MAGYILKISLEDAHPPVWCRVLVPERLPLRIWIR